MSRSRLRALRPHSTNNPGAVVRCCGAAIETLVQQLDGDDAASYDARARLVTLGGDATLAISDGLPALGRFGRLTAIEVFEEGADPRCGPALIALLNDDEPTVREWAAIALANLEIDGSCSAPPSPTQEWRGAG
ncbi:HEAT repeat domain-containing protein [Streptomyces sp. NPDC079189]|uniref:HEAT repeat domain-containing protein n=1 Tax=Streptomyces sp. NPDC079189 TaxID=3154514 RepID=UPI00342EF24B